jgi:hypothetical protein
MFTLLRPGTPVATAAPTFEARKKQPFIPYLVMPPVDLNNSVDRGKSREQVIDATTAKVEALKAKLEKLFAEKRVKTQVNGIQVLGAIGTLIVNCTEKVAQIIKQSDPELIVERGDTPMYLID